MAKAMSVEHLEPICDLDIRDRGNLDDEMRALVDGIEQEYGFMPNFVKLFATDNQRLKALMVPYMEVMRADSGLNALEHEMIALVCSVENGCSYCCAHHSARLRGESGDPLMTEYLSRNYKLVDLSDRHRAMLDFAIKVSRDAESITASDRQAVRDVGFDDEGIWYIASTAAFYASANRLAQAVGLKITPEYLDMNRIPAA